MQNATLATLALVIASSFGCGKKVDPDKTLECAQNQPYTEESACSECCGGDFKLSDTVCLCYE